MKLKAYAKINLSLNILGKFENGYHDMDMLIQAIDLYDIIDIKANQSGSINLTCTDDTLPIDIKNDAYKAAVLMKESFNIENGYDIHIEKNIPSAAGLGGGSADAACVINAIKDLENIKCTEKELFDIGLKIGAELPYMLKSGFARVKGIGEKVEQLDIKNDFYIVLVNPNISVSTAKVFSLYKLDKNKEKLYYNDKIIECLKLKNYDKAYLQMKNDLEMVTFKMYPELKCIKEKLINFGAKKSLMSGSGPSIYGIFEEFDLAEKARNYFFNKAMKSYALKLIYVV